MVPIAIVVILIVVVFTVALVLAPDPATLSIFGAQINTNTTGVYFTGAVTMLVLLLSLMLLRAGVSRSVRHRKEVRSLKEQAAVGTQPSTEDPKAGEKSRRRTKQGAGKSGADKRSRAEQSGAGKGSGRQEASTDRSSAAASDPAADRKTTPTAPDSSRSESAAGPANTTTTSADRQSLLDETDALLDDERER